MNRKTGELSRRPKSSSTTSDGAAMEAIRQAIQAEFVKGFTNLGINPGLHLDSSTAGDTEYII